MNSEFPAGRRPPLSQPPPKRQQLQLQGPRPTPLKLNKDSHKIKKPPPPPDRQPMIIYAISPKIIHADVADFMAIVQRHTGLSSGSFSNSGDISPAARLAATEKARAPEKSGDLPNSVEEITIRSPGILSPAPGSLPPVAAAYFSPVFHQDYNPFFDDNSGFIYSPALVSGPLISPTLSPDIFGQFWDF
ncbi:hypothetical protein SLA2020_002900 [Shorea laevis]